MISYVLEENEGKNKDLIKNLILNDQNCQNKAEELSGNKSSSFSLCFCINLILIWWTNEPSPGNFIEDETKLKCLKA